MEMYMYGWMALVTNNVHVFVEQFFLRSSDLPVEGAAR